MAQGKAAGKHQRETETSHFPIWKISLYEISEGRKLVYVSVYDFLDYEQWIPSRFPL